MTKPVFPIAATEIFRAAETLTKAFKNDTMMQWLLETPEEYDLKAHALFETWIKYCVLYGVALRTENFESIALRRKPGDIRLSFWRILRSGMTQLPKILGKDGMKRLNHLGKACDKAKKRTMGNQKFWHCWVLGTAPEKQRQDYGRAMMDATFALAKADKIPCYLETATNGPAQKVHGHVGYQVLESFIIPNSNLNMTTMIYQPKDDS